MNCIYLETSLVNLSMHLRTLQLITGVSLYKLLAVQIAAAGKLVQVATTLMAVQLLFVRAHRVPPRLFGDVD